MLLQINDILHHFVWGPGMLLLLMGCGIYLSCGTRLFQLTHARLWLRGTLGSIAPSKSRLSAAHDDSNGKSISPFQTFTNALAGTLGTGNIVGVATALAAGGAGAIFWMWVSAFFGMMTGYGENVLGMLYRKRSADGAWHGGPMYYLEHGLHAKWLAIPFALFAVLASFGMGNMTQANSIAGALEASFGFPPFAAGIACAAALALVAAGGIRRIGAVTEKLVPVMAILYIAGCGIILLRFRDGIPGAFADIFRGAFDLRSAAGGIGGYAILRTMRYGVARGVFSNEAGLGSSVLVHASSSASQPVEQGMWSICEIFIDTLVICTLTALCILSTGVMNTGADGAALVLEAFCAGLGHWGNTFLAMAVTLFAFSTLLCWSYNGELAAEYLFGTRCRRFYRFLFIALVPVGCMAELDIVWSISDTCNGLMAVPNLIGVMLLSGTIFRETRLYLDAHRPQTGRDSERTATHSFTKHSRKI